MKNGLLLMSVLLIAGCKTGSDTEVKDIWGQTDYRNSEDPSTIPEGERPKARWQVLYTTGGIAGPQATLKHIDAGKENKVVAYLPCNMRVCKNGQYRFTLANTDDTATLEMGNSKPIQFSCESVRGPGSNNILCNQSQPQVISARCTLTYEDKTEWIELKLDSKGKIIQWDDSKWAKTSSNAYWFQPFGENIEEYGFEWDKSFLTPNGYSILELGTTADAFKVGINIDEAKGFFTYSDHGSGTGDVGPLETVCKKM